MEMQVIKSKSTLELQEHEEELRAQLFALRIQKAIGKLDAPHMINQLRKDIARIKTELQIRSLNGEVIKPLNLQKMTLPEEKAKEKSKKAQQNKTKKTDKKVEKDTKVTKDTKKTSTKTNKETKVAKTAKEVKETKVKPTTKTTKSSTKVTKEDKHNDK